MKPIVLVTGMAAGWWGGFTFRTDAEKVLMLAVFISVIADWVTGVCAAYKEGVPVTSSRMRQGIYKLIGYFALILIAIATAQVLIASGVNLPKAPILGAALGLIFATEALSVLENVTRLTGLKTGFIQRLLKGIAPDEEPEKSEPIKPKRVRS